MDDRDQKIAELEKKVERALRFAIKSAEHAHLLEARLDFVEKNLESMHEGNKSIMEKLAPVFHTVFPKQAGFRNEVERIIGSASGPEEPTRKPE